MKVSKKQLEGMIRESVEEEISNLNEAELDELLGGLKGLMGGAGAGLKRAGQAVSSRANKVGSAVAGAARGAGQALAGAASNAAGAVKGAYQSGEKASSVQTLNKSIQSTIAAADKALQNAGGDQNFINAVDQVKQIIAHAGEQMKIEKLAECLREEKSATKTLRRKQKTTQG